MIEGIRRVRRGIHRNQRGQGPLIIVAAIVALVGLGIIIYGVSLLATAEGLGLIDIGVGLILLDVGGFVVIRTPTVLIGGIPGGVIIIIGIFLSQLGHV